MRATTIKIYEDTKSDLDTFREYKNESYDEVIKKVVYIAKNVKTEPELSIETVEAIQKARERMRKGKFLTEEEARQRLGLSSPSEPAVRTMRRGKEVANQ